MFAFLPRRLLKLVSRSLLAVLLFAQMAMAVHACGLASAPAQNEPVASMPCHSAHQAPVSQDETPNLCAVHCSSSAQSADTPQVTVFAAPVLPVLYITLPSADSPLARPSASPLTSAESPPIPIAILFGSFRC